MSGPANRRSNQWPKLGATLASLVLGAAALLPSTAAAQSAAVPCALAAGQPLFQSQFAGLKRSLGATMGEPVECPRVDSAAGDVLQATTTGLAVYRGSSETPTFNDGYRHWGFSGDQVLFWTGPSLDPPAGALTVQEWGFAYQYLNSTAPSVAMLQSRVTGSVASWQSGDGSTSTVLDELHGDLAQWQQLQAATAVNSVPGRYEDAASLDATAAQQLELALADLIAGVERHDAAIVAQGQHELALSAEYRQQAESLVRAASPDL